MQPSVAYSYRVLAADTLRDLVTLTFDLLTFVSGHTRRVTCWTATPSLRILYAYPLPFLHGLWVATSLIRYFGIWPHRGRLPSWKSKNRDISVTVWPIAANFGTITQFDHLHPGTLLGLQNLQLRPHRQFLRKRVTFCFIYTPYKGTRIIILQISIVTVIKESIRAWCLVFVF